MKLLHQVKLPLESQRGFRLFDIFFSILQINCMLVLSCTSIQKPTPLMYCELLTGMGRDALLLFCTSCFCIAYESIFFRLQYVIWS